ncbi:MAG: S8 family serine peptidase, partial [Clostridiales bacterium]|nr:S8 family serine peptidase [Clostridiales bacterium]
MFQKFRSTLALLLACALLLTCLPAPALAAEWTQTQSSAEESASEDGEISAAEEATSEEETSAAEEATSEEEETSAAEESTSEEETSAAEESTSEEDKTSAAEESTSEEDKTSAADESTSEEETSAAEESTSEEETSAAEKSTSEEEVSAAAVTSSEDAPVQTTWTTVTDATEVAHLVRDTWSDSYFQEAVVDPRRNRVTVDGEQADFDQVFDGVTEDEAEEILTSADTVEAYFKDTAYETEVQSNGTVSVTAPYQTCRILLTAKNLDEDYGAETILVYSAYDEYVLQFATEEDTQAAYAQLVARYGEENCFVDQVITADDLFLSDGEDVTAASTTYSWGCSYMGLDTLKADADADAETVTVAIIDSGIDADHAFFEGRTITGDSYDFLAGDDEDPTELSDPYGHGTHVAGIIVECTPDNVELLVLRILDDSGNSSLALVKTAMQYALEHGADVMNLSLGVSGSYTYLENIIQTVYDAGILVCCAAGNGSSDNVYYPANNAQTIAVSAIGSSGAFAGSYSNYGEEIDFCAPGTSIVSAASGGGTASKSGTSMASAYVAAALTYVIAAYPDASAAEQYSILQSCVTDLGDTGWDEYYGWGCVTNLAGMFDLSGLETQVTLSQTAYTYDGTAKEPKVTVQCGGLVLTQGTDYTVTYSDNVAAGTATVTVTGTGDYTGTVETTFVIAVADLSACTVTLSATSYTYDGSAKKPTVTVKNGSVTLVENTDYTVAYTNNVNYGTATVTITGTGSYSGTVTKTFSISALSTPSLTGISNTASGVKVTWKAV